jgi:hypothetical protein
VLLFAGDLARVKQTARRRRRYVAMPTSSSFAAATPPADASPPTDASSEETLSSLMAEKLRAGDSVDFGVSRMSSVRVQDMQRLGYFGDGVARVPGTEEVPEPEDELVVFEVFFAAGLRLPAHRFVGEVLRRFNVQIHQLTPNAVVALGFTSLRVPSKTMRDSPCPRCVLIFTQHTRPLRWWRRMRTKGPFGAPPA